MPAAPKPHKASTPGNLRSPGLVHPNIPRKRTNLLVIERTSLHLQSQLHLTVMITLMPNHVLKVKQRMIVVNLHLLATLNADLNRVAHGFSASVQLLRDEVGIAFVEPFSL